MQMKHIIGNMNVLNNNTNRQNVYPNEGQSVVTAGPPLETKDICWESNQITKRYSDIALDRAESNLSDDLFEEYEGDNTIPSSLEDDMNEQQNIDYHDNDYNDKNDDLQFIDC